MLYAPQSPKIIVLLFSGSLKLSPHLHHLLKIRKEEVFGHLTGFL
jgi:hypothetical protein